MRIKPALAAALTAVAALPLLALPAHAGPATCQATFPGGLVGDLVISSSHNLLAHAEAAKGKVAVDRVQVNYFGETRYRLAQDVQLINWRTGEKFVGGTGAFFAPRVGQEIKDTCVDKKLGGVRGPNEV